MEPFQSFATGNSLGKPFTDLKLNVKYVRPNSNLTRPIDGLKPPIHLWLKKAKASPLYSKMTKSMFFKTYQYFRSNLNKIICKLHKQVVSID